jgi:hypothetical protein
LKSELEVLAALEGVAIGAKAPLLLDNPSPYANNGTMYYRSLLRVYEATAPGPQPSRSMTLAAGLFVIEFIARRRQQIGR